MKPYKYMHTHTHIEILKSSAEMNHNQISSYKPKYYRAHTHSDRHLNVLIANNELWNKSRNNLYWIYLETARERSNPYRFQIYIDVIAIQLSYKLTYIYGI